MIMKQAHRMVHRLPARPVANELKMSVRSLLIPSTASSMLPSVPRRAFPLPQMVVIVDKDTQVMLEQIDTIPQMCSSDFMYGFALSGIVISIMHVVVNPANTAACVAMAEKLSLYKLSSCVHAEREVSTRCSASVKNSTDLFAEFDGRLAQVHFK